VLAVVADAASRQQWGDDAHVQPLRPDDALAVFATVLPDLLVFDAAAGGGAGPWSGLGTYEVPERDRTVLDLLRAARDRGVPAVLVRGNAPEEAPMLADARNLFSGEVAQGAGGPSSSPPGGGPREAGRPEGPSWPATGRRSRASREPSSAPTWMSGELPGQVRPRATPTAPTTSSSRAGRTCRPRPPCPGSRAGSGSRPLTCRPTSSCWRPRLRPGRTRPLRVVVAGHALHFLDAITEWLRGVDDVELRIDHVPSFARRDEAASTVHAEWADRVLCEWASPIAAW
jgi:hypothetical protein